MMGKTESPFIFQTCTEWDAHLNTFGVITAVTRREAKAVNLKTRSRKHTGVPCFIPTPTKHFTATHAHILLDACTMPHGVG